MSTPMQETREMHLTEDQIVDALMGELTAGATEHAASCAACAARLVEAEMPLASFKAVTTAWSERRSATMPAIVPQRAGLTARGRLAAWSVALSAMIVAGVAVPVVLHKQASPDGDGSVAHVVQAPVTAQAATTSVAEGSNGNAAVAATEAPAATGTRAARRGSSQDQISRDNAMLMDINRELDASSATSVLTLEQPHGPLAKPQVINE